METWQLLVLVLVQGITEFLPISSSGHLILVSKLAGWPDQGLAFDIAVHLGSLVAVITYFRKDLIDMLAGCINAAVGKGVDHSAQLAFLIIIASLPVVVAGLAGKDWIEANLRSSLIIAVTTFGFAVLLLIADIYNQRRAGRTGFMAVPGAGAALLIGIAQIFALVPGTSRSGVTMTAGLFLGLSREATARFSFLLAMPAIAGAALLSLLDLLEAGIPASVWLDLTLAFLLSAVSSYICIRLFLNTISYIGFLPFVAYRILLAAFLLFVV